MPSITAPSWATEVTVTATCTTCRLPHRAVAGRTADGAPVCADCLDPEILGEVLLYGQHQIDAVIAEFERSVAGRDDTNAITMRTMAAALRAVSLHVAQAEIH